MTAVVDLLRPVLEDRARAGATVTYADLARTAGVPPPHTVHKTAEALEALMELDAGDGVPLLAAVVISKARDGIPAPGFFQKATELGLYFGPDRGPQAATFHTLELRKVWAAYGPGAR
jgi:hypothetical protein